MSSKQNDLAAFNGLFQEHYGLVVAVARWFAPSWHQADDIVQQVYIDFVRCGLEGKLDTTKGIRSFLYHITKRRAMLTWRHQTNDQKRFRDIADLSELLAVSPDERGDEHNRLEEEARLLKECLEMLPERSREIVRRHYFDDIGMKQLAEDHDQSHSAMRHFFCRVRLKLRKCIEGKKKY